MERRDVQNKDEDISPAQRVFNIPELAEKILVDFDDLETFATFNFEAYKLIVAKKARLLEEYVKTNKFNFAIATPITKDRDVLL